MSDARYLDDSARLRTEAVNVIHKDARRGILEEESPPPDRIGGGNDPRYLSFE